MLLFCSCLSHHGTRKIQTVCKPGSVRILRWWTAIPLGPALPPASRDQPGRRIGNAPASLRRRKMPAAPIRSCSRWGLPCQPCRQGRGALLPHRFTLTIRACAGMAVCFLWHCPWGRPRRPLAGTVLPWSPDFPPPDFAPAAAVRPSGSVLFAGSGGLVNRGPERETLHYNQIMTVPGCTVVAASNVMRPWALEQGSFRSNHLIRSKAAILLAKTRLEHD